MSGQKLLSKQRLERPVEDVGDNDDYEDDDDEDDDNDDDVSCWSVSIMIWRSL